MRAIGLSVLLMLAGTTGADARTLLETVLYVVSLFEPRIEPHDSTTVTEEGEWIHGEEHALNPGTIFPDLLVRSTWVRRLSGCKFEVNDTWAISFRDSHYVVDFSSSAFEEAHESTNPFGILPPRTVVIPDTRYCHLTGSRPYLNAIQPGSCVDLFFVEPDITPKGVPKMLAAIHDLRALCTPKVS